MKKGDILVDSYGNVYKVTVARRDETYPYITKCISGKRKGRGRVFGANGEFWGTGIPGSKNDVTLDIDYLVNKMWEEYKKD